MGRDASFYALKSKKELYIDRARNLEIFQELKWQEIITPLDLDYLDELYTKSYEIQGLNRDEITVLIAGAITAWEQIGYFDGDKERDQSHKRIITRLLEEVYLLPKDETFVFVIQGSEPQELMDLCGVKWFKHNEPFKFIDCCL